MKQNSISIYDTPSLMTYWDQERNTIDPKKFSQKSNKNAWWVCKNCGTVFERTVESQFKGMKLCRECTIKETARHISLSNLRNKGSIKSVYPQMAEEWDYTKNAPLKPEDVSYCSAEKYWWKCKTCGNEWLASPNARYSHGMIHGCRKCSFQKSVDTRRLRDMQTTGPLSKTNPDIAAEWDYDKNAGITPETITKRFIGRVWFRCPFGHSYRQMVSEKVRECLGCPKCSQKTSFPEQAIAYYLSKITDVKSNFKHNGFELDVFLPDINCAIEYDGYRFHNTKSKKESDNKKTHYCQQVGIKLLRIRETPKRESTNFTIYVSPNNDEWVKLLSEICIELNLPIIRDIDIDRDRNIILARVSGKNYEKTLAFKRPFLLKYWDTDKNLPLTPDKISNRTRILVWWICPHCGRSYRRTLNNQKREVPLCVDCAYEQARIKRKLNKESINQKN